MPRERLCHSLVGFQTNPVMLEEKPLEEGQNSQIHNRLPPTQLVLVGLTGRKCHITEMSSIPHKSGRKKRVS
jgi:hypothetical protein